MFSRPVVLCASLALAVGAACSDEPSSGSKPISGAGNGGHQGIGFPIDAGHPRAGSGGAGAAGHAGAVANAGTGASAGGTSGGSAAGASGTSAQSGDAGAQSQSAGSDGDDGDDGADSGAQRDASVSDDEDAAVDDDDTSDEVDGDGDPNWPPPPATEALADLPERLADGICGAIERCLGPTLRELVFDGADCRRRTAADIEDGDFVYMQASIDAGRIAFDPSAIAQCVQDYEALGCDLVASRLPGSCDAVLHGQVPAGGACVIDDDCSGAAFCDRGATCPGQCQALLPANAACDRNDQCLDGLECLAGKCTRAALADEACAGGVAPDCHLGLFCIGADDGADAAGACRAEASLLVKGEGEPCDAVGGAWCREGLACVIDVFDNGGTPTLTQVCRARVASGAQCHTSLVPQQCPADEYCPADLDPEYIAQCAPRPGNGEPCGTFNTCAPDLRCDGGVCRATRRRIGAACSAAGDCLTQRCLAAADGSGSHCVALDRCRLDPETPEPTCGDTLCDGAETCASCAGDCGACPPPEPTCGDGACNGSETCSTCAGDCGACPPPEPRCGDGACNGSETCSACPGDCGVCAPVCGDHSCDTRESCASCAADCGACPAPYSGPCDSDDDCAPSQRCKQQTTTGLFGGRYANCAEPCDAAGDCAGSPGQRSCGADQLCALRCSVLECLLLDQDRCCPVGMECVNSVCNWLR